MKRTLSVKRETLAELTADELTAVNGAQAQTNVGPTCPLFRCLPTFQEACATGNCTT